jgi:hypothetical protein
MPEAKLIYGSPQTLYKMAGTTVTTTIPTSIREDRRSIPRAVT